MNGRTNVTTGPNGGAIDIPLDPPTAFAAEGSHEKISLTWVDPKNKYATPEGEAMEDTDQLVSTWDHTVIVRKTDGYPATPDDGILVISSGQRNQYQTTPYIDTGLTNQTQYYYAAFAFNTDGVPSEPAYVDCFLYGYDTVLENNSWEYIDRACSEGLHTSLWEIGDTKPITVNLSTGTETFNLEILDFDHDDLSDDSGKAAITFGTHECTSAIVAISTLSYHPYMNYTQSKLYKYMNTVYGVIDSELKPYIRQVTKTQVRYTSSGDKGTFDDVGTFNCYLFPPGVSETDPSYKVLTSGPLFGDSGEGYQYPYYATVANRIKMRTDGSDLGDEIMEETDYYPTRTMGPYTRGYESGSYHHDPYLISAISGTVYANYTQNGVHVVFLCCIGKTN